MLALPSSETPAFVRFCTKPFFRKKSRLFSNGDLKNLSQWKEIQGLDRGPREIACSLRLLRIFKFKIESLNNLRKRR